MAQVTSKPGEPESKMNEEKRVKEGAGSSAAPKADLQPGRFEWPGLAVGPGSDLLVYKQNQRKLGEVPQGVQTVPAIWLPSPHGAPWQYGGLAENSIANGHPPPTQLLTWRMKNIMACGGLVLLLLMLLSYIDRHRILTRFRSRRPQVQSTVKVICQVCDEPTVPDLPPKFGSPDICDKPPSYSRYPQSEAESAPKEEKQNNTIPPFSCIFTSGKGKVPRVLLFDTRNEQKMMEEMGLGKISGPSFVSQQMNINVPTQVDGNDPKRETANLVIEINDPESESGCVIGMDVLVNKDEHIAFIEKREVPFTITVEKLNVCDNHITKGDGEATK